MEPPSFPSTGGVRVARAAPGGDAAIVLPLPSGSPPFHYEWSRAGAKLDDRFKPTHDAGGVRLTISAARTGDSGVYTLQATNAAGKDSTRVRLEVSPDEEPIGDDPPTFLRRLQDLTVKVGTRTRFLVEIVSSTECRVTWYRNERRLLEAERIALVRDGNFWCADISAVSVDDAGRWTCTAENVGGRASCSAHLNVLVPKAYKRPEFVEELRALLTEQGTVSLECKVVGVPTPVLRWFKDSCEIKAGDVFALTANADDPTSLGTYTCEAVNCMGRAYSSSKVHVIGRASREGSARPTSGVAGLEPPPIFTKELEDQFVRICEPLTLSCNIVVPPWPRSIVWYNKEGKVEPSNKYRILEDGVGGYLLEVPSAEWQDEGEWKCVATSSGGRIGITTCYVSMDVPKNYRKPRFMENLQAVLTEEGLVSFECKVVGFPTPVLSWFKDGQELKPGDVYQLTGTNSLGSYCCIAKNCMGQTSSSAELTVEDIQNQLNEEEKLQLFTKNQAPKFLQGLKSVEAKIDEPFRFTIRVAIPPEPTVLWYRDDQPVDESSRCHHGKEERGVFFLEIKSLEFMDQAEWKCVAMNDFGHSVTSCFLKLIIPRHYKKPRFLENLQAILSDEGAVNLECKVIGVPQPVLKWYKDGEELKPGDIHRIISGQDGTCCLGTYTCEAQNCMGIAASSASLLGFEDSIKAKSKSKVDEQTLQRNLSLSTIHEERTSQMYDTPVGDITLDDKGEISFSFDGKEVSVSLYETPDLTEEEALQIVEMYADQLSENVTEHNVVELPPLRFVKETSTSGNLLMEAIIIDVSPEYFTSPEEDLRTEADIEDISIADENGPPQLSLDQEVDGEDYLEKTMALLSEEKADFPKKMDRKKSDSHKSGDDYFSLSQDQSLSEEKKDDDTQVLSESDVQSFASARSNGKPKSKSSKPSVEDGQESSDITRTVLLKEDFQTMCQFNEIELNVKNKRERRSRSARRSSSGSDKMKEEVLESNLENILIKNIFKQEGFDADINSISLSLTKVIHGVQMIERDTILKSELMSSAATAARSLEIINNFIEPLTEIQSIIKAIGERLSESDELTTSLFNKLPQSISKLYQTLTIIEKCMDIESENKTLVKKTCTNIIDKCGEDLNNLFTEINSIVNKVNPYLDDICVVSIQSTTNKILKTIRSSEEALNESKKMTDKSEIKLDKVTLDTKHLQKTQKAVYELRNPLKSLLYIAEEVDVSSFISAENIINQIILNDMSIPIQDLQSALEQIENLSVSETQSDLQQYNTEIIEMVMDPVLKLRTSIEQLSVKAVTLEKEEVLSKALLDIKHNINEISNHLDKFEEKIGHFNILQSENKLEALQKMAQILINLENNVGIFDFASSLKTHVTAFHKNLTKVLEHVIESNDANKYFAFLDICDAVNRLNTVIKNVDSNDMLSLAGISNNLKTIQAIMKKNEFTPELNFSITSNITELLLNIHESINYADTSSYSMISENVEDLSIRHLEEEKLNIMLEHIEKAISLTSNVVSLETTKDFVVQEALNRIIPTLEEIKYCVASLNVTEHEENISDMRNFTFTQAIANPLCELNHSISVLNQVMCEKTSDRVEIDMLKAELAIPLLEIRNALEILQQDVVSQNIENIDEVNVTIADVVQSIQSCIIMIQEQDVLENADELSTLEDISAIKTSAEILGCDHIVSPIVQEITTNFNEQETFDVHVQPMQSATKKTLRVLNHHMLMLQSPEIIETLNTLSTNPEYSNVKSVTTELGKVQCAVSSILLDESQKVFNFINLSQLAALVQPLEDLHQALVVIDMANQPLESTLPIDKIELFFKNISSIETCVRNTLDYLHVAIETADVTFEISTKTKTLHHLCEKLNIVLETAKNDGFVENSQLVSLHGSVNTYLNVTSCSEGINIAQLKLSLERLHQIIINVQDEILSCALEKPPVLQHETQILILFEDIKNTIASLAETNFVNIFESAQENEKEKYEKLNKLESVVDRIENCVKNVPKNMLHNSLESMKDIVETCNDEMSQLCTLLKQKNTPRRIIKILQVFYDLCQNFEELQLRKKQSSSVSEDLSEWLINSEETLKNVQGIIFPVIDSQSYFSCDIPISNIKSDENVLNKILEINKNANLCTFVNLLMDSIKIIKPWFGNIKSEVLEELESCCVHSDKDVEVDTLYDILEQSLSKNIHSGNDFEAVHKVIQNHSDCKRVKGSVKKIIFINCVADCLHILKQSFVKSNERLIDEESTSQEQQLKHIITELSEPFETFLKELTIICDQNNMSNFEKSYVLKELESLQVQLDTIHEVIKKAEKCLEIKNIPIDNDTMTKAKDLITKIDSAYNHFKKLENILGSLDTIMNRKTIEEMKTILSTVLSKAVICKENGQIEEKSNSFLQHMEHYIEVIEIVEETCAVLKLDDFKKSANIVRELRENLMSVSSPDIYLADSQQMQLVQNLQNALTSLQAEALESKEELASPISDDVRQQIVTAVSELQNDLIAITSAVDENSEFIETSKKIEAGDQIMIQEEKSLINSHILNQNEHYAIIDSEETQEESLQVTSTDIVDEYALSKISQNEEHLANIDALNNLTQVEVLESKQELASPSSDDVRQQIVTAVSELQNDLIAITSAVDENSEFLETSKKIDAGDQIMIQEEKSLINSQILNQNEHHAIIDSEKTQEESLQVTSTDIVDEYALSKISSNEEHLANIDALNNLTQVEVLEFKQELASPISDDVRQQIVTAVSELQNDLIAITSAVDENSKFLETSKKIDTGDQIMIQEEKSLINSQILNQNEHHAIIDSEETQEESLQVTSTDIVDEYALSKISQNEEHLANIDALNNLTQVEVLESKQELASPSSDDVRQQIVTAVSELQNDLIAITSAVDENSEFLETSKKIDAGDQIMIQEEKSLINSQILNQNEHYAIIDSEETQEESLQVTSTDIVNEFALSKISQNEEHLANNDALNTLNVEDFCKNKVIENDRENIMEVLKLNIDTEFGDSVTQDNKHMKLEEIKESLVQHINYYLTENVIKDITKILSSENFELLEESIRIAKELRDTAVLENNIPSLNDQDFLKQHLCLVGKLQELMLTINDKNVYNVYNQTNVKFAVHNLLDCLQSYANSLNIIIEAKHLSCDSKVLEENKCKQTQEDLIKTEVSICDENISVTEDPKVNILNEKINLGEKFEEETNIDERDNEIKAKSDKSETNIVKNLQVTESKEEMCDINAPGVFINAENKNEAECSTRDYDFSNEVKEKTSNITVKTTSLQDENDLASEEIFKEKQSSINELETLLKEVNETLDLNYSSELQDTLDEMQTVIMKLKCEFDGSTNDILNEYIEDLECSIRSVQLQINENSPPELLHEECMNLQTLVTAMNNLYNTQTKSLQLPANDAIGICTSDVERSIDLLDEIPCSNVDIQLDNIIFSLNEIKNTMKSLKSYFSSDAESLILRGIEVSQLLNYVEDKVFALEKDLDAKTKIDTIFRDGIVSAIHSIYGSISNMRGTISSIQKRYMYENYGQPSDNFLKSIKNVNLVLKYEGKEQWKQFAKSLRKVLNHFEDIKFYINFDKTARLPSDSTFTKIILSELCNVISEELSQNINKSNEVSDAVEQVVSYVREILYRMENQTALEVKDKIPIFKELSNRIINLTNIVKNQIKETKSSDDVTVVDKTDDIVTKISTGENTEKENSNDLLDKLLNNNDTVNSDVENNKIFEKILEESPQDNNNTMIIQDVKLSEVVNDQQEKAHVNSEEKNKNHCETHKKNEISELETSDERKKSIAEEKNAEIIEFETKTAQDENVVLKKDNLNLDIEITQSEGSETTMKIDLSSKDLQIEIQNEQEEIKVIDDSKSGFSFIRDNSDTKNGKRKQNKEENKMVEDTITEENNISFIDNPVENNDVREAITEKIEKCAEAVCSVKSNEGVIKDTEYFSIDSSSLNKMNDTTPDEQETESKVHEDGTKQQIHEIITQDIITKSMKNEMKEEKITSQNKKEDIPTKSEVVLERKLDQHIGLDHPNEEIIYFESSNLVAEQIDLEEIKGEKCYGTELNPDIVLLAKSQNEEIKIADHKMGEIVSLQNVELKYDDDNSSQTRVSSYENNEKEREKNLLGIEKLGIQLTEENLADTEKKTNLKKNVDQTRPNLAELSKELKDEDPDKIKSEDAAAIKFISKSKDLEIGNLQEIGLRDIQLKEGYTAHKAEDDNIVKTAQISNKIQITDLLEPQSSSSINLDNEEEKFDKLKVNFSTECYGQNTISRTEEDNKIVQEEVTVKSETKNEIVKEEISKYSNQQIKATTEADTEKEIRIDEKLIPSESHDLDVIDRKQEELRSNLQEKEIKAIHYKDNKIEEKSEVLGIDEKNNVEAKQFRSFEHDEIMLAGSVVTNYGKAQHLSFEEEFFEDIKHEEWNPMDKSIQAVVSLDQKEEPMAVPTVKELKVNQDLWNEKENRRVSQTLKEVEDGDVNKNLQNSENQIKQPEVKTLDDSNTEMCTELAFEKTVLNVENVQEDYRKHEFETVKDVQNLSASTTDVTKLTQTGNEFSSLIESTGSDNNDQKYQEKTIMCSKEFGNVLDSQTQNIYPDDKQTTDIIPLAEESVKQFENNSKESNAKIAINEKCEESLKNEIKEIKYALSDTGEEIGLSKQQEESMEKTFRNLKEEVSVNNKVSLDIFDLEKNEFIGDFSKTVDTKMEKKSIPNEDVKDLIEDIEQNNTLEYQISQIQMTAQNEALRTEKCDKDSFCKMDVKHEIKEVIPLNQNEEKFYKEQVQQKEITENNEKDVLFIQNPDILKNKRDEKTNIQVNKPLKLEEETKSQIQGTTQKNHEEFIIGKKDDGKQNRSDVNFGTTEESKLVQFDSPPKQSFDDSNIINLEKRQLSEPKSAEKKFNTQNSLENVQINLDKDSLRDNESTRLEPLDEHPKLEINNSYEPKNYQKSSAGDILQVEPKMNEEIISQINIKTNKEEEREVQEVLVDNLHKDKNIHEDEKENKKKTSKRNGENIKKKTSNINKVGKKVDTVMAEKDLGQLPSKTTHVESESHKVNERKKSIHKEEINHKLKDKVEASSDDKTITEQKQDDKTNIDLIKREQPNLKKIIDTKKSDKDQKLDDTEVKSTLKNIEFEMTKSNKSFCGESKLQQETQQTKSDIQEIGKIDPRMLEKNQHHDQKLKQRPLFVDRSEPDYELEFARPSGYTTKQFDNDQLLTEFKSSGKSPTIYKAQTLLHEAQLKSSIPPYLDQQSHDSLEHTELKPKRSDTRSTVSEKRGSFPRDVKRKAVFSTYLTDRTAVEGSRVKLTCSILSSADSVIHWYKNGIPLDNKQKCRTKHVDGLITLEILNAVPSDSGEYSCTVENEYGSITSSAILKVYPGFEASPIPPTFTRSIRDVYHSHENELVLECRIRGQPLPIITWFKDNRPITLNERYQAHYLADGVCRLTIASPTDDDSGKYTCKAENSMWSDQISHDVHFSSKKSCHLINVATTENIRRNRQTTDSRRPHFTNVLSDHKVVHGGTIGLQVQISGSPTRVEWLREGRSVTETYRNAQTYTDHGLYTLALPDVTEKESGLYTCRAWSTHGAVDMNASVIVVQPNQYEGKPATIISRPVKDLLISSGEDLNVSFRVRGEPKPKVFFMKGIRDITNSQRVCKMTSDDYVKFTLKRSVVSDAGTYCVFVRNAYGCDRAFVTVVIRQRASSDNLISDWTYPMDDLAISVVERNYKSVPDRIPSEPTTVDGGSNWVALAWPKPDSQVKAPILAYKVESWLLGKEGGARWIELGITPRNSFDAFNLKQGGEYHFRVTPRNRYGWGESVQTSTPICIGLTGDRPEFINILPGQLKVLVGETASLCCSFKGNPMPEIMWMKNGHEIEEETERVTVGLNGNNTSLRINNLRIEDEGRYSCEATNIHGRSSTYSRMAVITDKQIWEADAKLKRERSAGANGEYPPQFTMRLRDRRVQATYPVRLTCQVIGSPRPTITWFKNGEEVSVDNRHSTSQDECFYTLEIAPTTLEDGGVYEAMARNGFGAISCRCNLVVDKGIRAYIAPEFCCGFEPLYRVCEGDELRISAVVEAYPSVGVAWYRDGVRLRPSRRAVMTLDRDGQIELAVASVAARDAGVYTCTASNEVGRASTSGKVEVIKGEHTSEVPKVPPIVISSDLPYSKEPMFIRKPRSSEAREGDTVIIECEVIGDPKPDVYWLRDFLKPDYYRDASHFKRIGAGPAYRFEIPHAKFDYTGAYSIVAKNIHGEAKAIISLQILAKDITCTDDTHNIRYGRVETIPRFEKELTDLLCYDGDAIEFECRVSGNPEPDIRWFHYTEVIPHSQDFETSYDLGTSRLKIKQVTAEDEGTYTCEASNNMGTATSSACLVIYPPGEPNTLSQRLRRPPALMSASSTPRSTPRTTPARSLSRTPGPDFRRLGSPSREIAPKFYTYPYNRVVEEGDTVVFQCAVSGLPPPWATWDKDGIIITPTSRISIREKDDMYRILEIEQVSIEDVGLYRVTLENDYGRAEASARLEVITQMGKFYGSRSYSVSPRKCLSYRRRTPSLTRQD